MLVQFTCADGNTIIESAEASGASAYIPRRERDVDLPKTTQGKQASFPTMHQVLPDVTATSKLIVSSILCGCLTVNPQPLWFELSSHAPPKHLLSGHLQH